MSKERDLRAAKFTFVRINGESMLVKALKDKAEVTEVFLWR